MNKKSKRNLILTSLVIIFLIGLWFYLSALKAPLPTASQAPLSNVPTSSSASAATLVVTNPTNVVAPTPEQMQAAHEAEVNREKGIWTLLFATPITFYGKVVDEKAVPIEGAKATIAPTDNYNGSSTQYERTTDKNGLFSIWGIHGLGISVDVSKDGYYILPQSGGHFGYGPGNAALPPHTNPNDPAIFILKKRGESERLIKISCDVKTQKDGTPIQMNLTTGWTYHVTNGDIQVESWTYNQGNPMRYDWRCKITVLGGGGLQPRSGGEFDFTAPEDGYQPSDEISMSASDPNWMSSQSREYFLKLANGDYARISFTIAADNNNGFSITSYLNPQPGRPNLEFDPAKQINK